MKGYFFLALFLAACASSVLWTVWYFWGHLTGQVGHLGGSRRTAYQWQLEGYKAERRGDLQGAVDAYGESLRADPTNHDLEARRARLMELIASQNEDI